MIGVAEPPAVEAGAGPSAGQRRFRPDIQGLRAVAVTLVVLYHAGVPGLTGGYVGVDVFFVISGFLITGQLLRDVVERGRIDVVDFYARRARRLLAPAAVVLAATLAAAVAWLPPLRVRSLATDVIFTAVYGLNYRLAAQGIDYQQEGAAVSALQHYWSLAVEEQFYVVWPALIMLVVLLFRKRWTMWLPIALTVGACASLLLSQVLVQFDAPLAYFSLQSRAWELGFGALVAVARQPLTALPAGIREPATYVGLAAIVASGVLFGATTPFPGYFALLPVAGTAVVIAAGCAGPSSSERLLGLPIIQLIGRLSYPWYLWHWPVMVLAPAVAVGVRFGWLENLGLMLLALALASLTHALVERPIHASPANLGSWLAAAALMASGSVVVALAVNLQVSMSLGALVPVQASGQSPTASALTAHASAADPFGSPSSGPVRPSVIDAVDDTPASPAECIVDVQQTVSPRCEVGPRGEAVAGPVTGHRVVLLGDSHAGQWFAPVHAIAASHGWSTEVLTKVGCPLQTLTVQNAMLKRAYSECDTWRSGALRRLAAEPRPQIVFVGALDRYAVGAPLASAWQTTLAHLRALRAPVVYLRDTPTPDADIPTCMSKAIPRWSPCAFARSRALPLDPLATASRRTYGLSAVVDVNGYLCPGRGTSCPAARGGILLYRDASHVTSTAMTAMTPAVREQLRAAGLPN